MTRKAALTVRLPGARIAPAKSTWTCGHRRLENSGTKGFSKCSIVDGRVRIITSLWRTGDDRTLPLLTLTKWTKSSSETVRKASSANQTPRHQTAHRYVDERFASLRQPLVVFAHPSVVVYPGERPLHYPPTW